MQKFHGNSKISSLFVLVIFLLPPLAQYAICARLSLPLLLFLCVCAKMQLITSRFSFSCALLSAIYHDSSYEWRKKCIIIQGFLDFSLFTRRKRERTEKNDRQQWLAGCCVYFQIVSHRAKYITDFKFIHETEKN